ncbi:hypothetical protein SMAC4_13798 [Sordaria macrospora]|uniref:uncharacterized protein n=1 Tax=Sordaria macrospora TaxID=5147 RepID=UPI002B3219E6|nr:hypothetical protein SMAC4_13798 [Sordaria macrospora]
MRRRNKIEWCRYSPSITWCHDTPHLTHHPFRDSEDPAATTVSNSPINFMEAGHNSARMSSDTRSAKHCNCNICDLCNLDLRYGGGGIHRKVGW